ncbi:amidohydrolase family protein [Caballeronia sp. 15711]|uniref:amidohydrolase family protein n=1 Tax=Caballeronia sp. 15711 TaxID=3391029 RepID=UPI0039E55754
MSTLDFVCEERLVAHRFTGSEPPETSAPFGATDCHHHIVDPHYARIDGRPVPYATVVDYELFKRRFGLTRSIVAAPSSYCDGNRCLLEALDDFGSEIARGIAIARVDVQDSVLRELHARGLRGLRFYPRLFGRVRPLQLSVNAYHIRRLQRWHRTCGISSLLVNAWHRAHSRSARTRSF